MERSRLENAALKKNAAEQWLNLLDLAAEFRAFISAQERELKSKNLIEHAS